MNGEHYVYRLWDDFDARVVKPSLPLPESAALDGCPPFAAEAVCCRPRVERKSKNAAPEEKSEAAMEQQAQR